jgi:hypothetical protein
MLAIKKTTGASKGSTHRDQTARRVEDAERDAADEAGATIWVHGPVVESLRVQLARYCGRPPGDGGHGAAVSWQVKSTKLDSVGFVESGGLDWLITEIVDEESEIVSLAEGQLNVVVGEAGEDLFSMHTK